MGLITEEERYDARQWMSGARTTEKVQDVIQKRLEEYGSVYIMASPGAKGNISPDLARWPVCAA